MKKFGKILMMKSEEYKKYLDLINNIYSMIFKECDSLFYGII